MTASVKAGFSAQDYESRASGSTDGGPVHLSRDSKAVQASLDVPITSRSNGVAPALGDLSLNLNGKVEHLSDFGTLYTHGAGLNWSLGPALSMNMSLASQEGAPSMQQLGAPVLLTPNLPAFDYVNSETVDILRIDGGNPALMADSQKVMKIGAYAKPFEALDFSIHANYLQTRTDRPILSFPAASAEIEAAFPDRFSRDASGRLLAIDARPVNFDRREQKEVRWGVSLSKPLAKAPPGAQFRFNVSEGSIPATLPPGAMVIRAEAGSALANQVMGMMSRLYINVTHRWRLQDDIAIRDSLPALDLLDGDAMGPRGGAAAHELEIQAGVGKRGIGARVSGQWRSGSRVFGPEEAGPASDLEFSSYATVGVNLFADLGQRLGGPNAPWWARDTRLNLSINNVFDSRPEVRDGAGAVPYSYQPAFLDPLGRSAMLTLRRQFR